MSDEFCPQPFQLANVPAFDPMDGPLTNEEFKLMVNNVMAMRGELFRQLTDPRRNIEYECGHPQVNTVVDPSVYQSLSERDPIAIRVVQVQPKECWQLFPDVYEKESGKVTTPFEQRLKNVTNTFYGEPSYHEEEEQCQFWDFGALADEQAGICRYGVILFGLNDKLKLSQPAKAYSGGKFNPTTDEKELIDLNYISVFPEWQAQIGALDEDPTSPRYKQPLNYNINFEGGSQQVHWTRCIHVPGDISKNILYAPPRMEAVLNNLLDLKKLYGGSSEMYWRGAFPGISFESHPQLNPSDIVFNKTKLRREMENYSNGLQRYLTLMGMTAKSMAPQVVDPTPQIRVQIEAICIRLAVPKRIFMGSERGELASVQDDKNWNNRVKERRRGYVTRHIVAPMVNRLINLRVAPKPTRFIVKWPEVAFQSEQDRARVAIVLTEAIIRYAESLPNPVIAPFDFYTRILGMTVLEATTVLDAVKKLGWDKFVDITIAAMAGNPIPDGTRGNGKKKQKGSTSFLKPSLGTVASSDGAGLKIPGGAGL